MSLESGDHDLWKENFKLKQQIREKDDEILAQRLESDRLRKRLQQEESQNIQLQIQLQKKERNIEHLNDMLHIESRPLHLTPLAAPDLHLEPPKQTKQGDLGSLSKLHQHAQITTQNPYMIPI